MHGCLTSKQYHKSMESEGGGARALPVVEGKWQETLALEAGSGCDEIAAKRTEDGR
jgi:hypothetical protein